MIDESLLHWEEDVEGLVEKMEEWEVEIVEQLLCEVVNVIHKSTAEHDNITEFEIIKRAVWNMKVKI